MTVSTKTAAQAAPRNDWLTVAAMAVVTYLLSAFTHEMLGHGVASLLVGARIVHVTSLDLVYDASHLTAAQGRFIAAAGCAAQFILAGILILVYRAVRDRVAPTTRYFLWLLLYINLFIPAGYLMALSFAPFGDWNDFVQGLPQQVLWRLGFTVLGTAITFAAAIAGARALDPFLGRDQAERSSRALVLTLVAYLAGSIVNTLAGVLNPDGAILVLISAAAASFGGTIFLFWTGRFAVWMFKPTPATPAVPLTVTRSLPWLVAGGVAALIYFVVLGPGVPR